MAIKQSETSIEIKWRTRAQPLKPIGVAGRGRVARALAQRLLARDEMALSLLKGSAGADVLIVLGAEELLPWVDGVTYLGRDEAAPSLLLPTTHQPSVPLPLFECALLKRNLLAPIAVLLDPPAMASVNAARTISRATLMAWLQSEVS